MSVSAEKPGFNVVVAGSNSATGRAVVRSLCVQGARVAAVDLNDDGVRALAEEHKNVIPYVCNLADLSEVTNLRDSVRADLGPIDGLIHLVGGWRGGDSIVDQQDGDWDVLHTSVLTTLRNTSRAFYNGCRRTVVGRDQERNGFR